MDNSRKDKKTHAGRKTIFDCNLFTKLLLPIAIPLVNTVIIVYFIADLNKPKTGELNILSDQDSTEVILNGEYKGITGPDDKYPDIFVLKISSVFPGTYPLILKKKSFVPLGIPDVEINPGYLTSKSASLEPLLNSELSKLPDTTKRIRTDLKKPEKGHKLTEGKIEKTVTSEAANISRNTIQIAPKLSIWLTGEIPLSKVNLFVNSSFICSLSSDRISIELQEGKNEITFIYSDLLGIKHTYSTTMNISGNDTLFVTKNDFNPKIRN